jgi:hypothetical protein
MIKKLLIDTYPAMVRAGNAGSITQAEVEAMRNARTDNKFLCEIMIDRCANTQWMFCCETLYKAVTARRILLQQAFTPVLPLIGFSTIYQQLQASFLHELSSIFPGISMTAPSKVAYLKPLVKRHKNCAWRYIQASMEILKQPASHIVYCILTAAREAMATYAHRKSTDILELEEVRVKYWHLIETLEEFTLNAPPTINCIYKGDMEAMFENCQHELVVAANNQLLNIAYNEYSNDTVLVIHKKDRRWIWRPTGDVPQHAHLQWIGSPKVQGQALCTLDRAHASGGVGQVR